MPTTYAHWRFGNKCISSLNDNYQELINNNRAIFDFGVHGPDIFFYYNCIKHNEINQFGTKLHNIPFGETLEKMKPLFEKAEDKKSVLSYLLGFTCHFALDSYCHGYIDRAAEVGDVTHGKIESQLDRYFLIKDGYDPVKKSVTFSLKPGRRIAHDIAILFPELKQEDVYKSIKDQLFYLSILKDNNDIKRWGLIKAMDIAKAPAFKELLITKSNDERCKATNARLDKYFEKAAEHYPILAKSLIDFLEKGKPLDPYFHNDFCPKEDYKDIPILSYEDELKYEVNEFQK